jgi:hypothetical protein
MSAVVANPVHLHRPSTLTPTLIPTRGTVANLAATPNPPQKFHPVDSDSVDDTPASGTQRHGKSWTGVRKPKPTQSDAPEDQNSHRPLGPGVWSWRHPHRPGSSPISSADAPSASGKTVEKLNSGDYLNGLIARGGPPSKGKTMLDPLSVVENNRRVQATRHAEFQRKREVPTENPPNPSSSASVAAPQAATAASVPPVAQSRVQSAVSSAAPVAADSAAVSAAASGTSILKSSISSASSSSSSASASANAKKRGILYNSASSANAFIGKPLVSWALNWYSAPQSFSASGVEYSPSLWAPKQLFLVSWQDDAKAAIAAGAKAILGFYEPDQEKGANLNAADAASAYKRYITDLFGGSAKLGSVGVSNLAYLSQFMSACSACKIDFINIHWSDTYDSGTAQRFKDYVDSAWTKFQKPIWVGEFGFKSPPFPTADQQIEFLKAVLPWLDQHQHVDRYAYYMASNMTNGGTLNSVGTTYATFSGTAPG